MAQKKQISNKYRTRSVTYEEDGEIQEIQRKEGLGTYLEAKNKYFEAQDAAKDIDKKAKKEVEKIKERTKKEGKRKLMTVAETKLGITVVLTAEECKTLGIPGTTMTREAIQQVKKKLGLGAA